MKVVFGFPVVLLLLLIAIYLTSILALIEWTFSPRDLT